MTPGTEHRPSPRPAMLLDPAASTPIASLGWRDVAQVTGRVRSMRVWPVGDVASLECVLVDDTGGLWIVFLGRRSIAGIRPGTVMTVAGRVGNRRDRLAIMNPVYTLSRDAPELSASGPSLRDRLFRRARKAVGDEVARCPDHDRPEAPRAM